MRILLLTQVVPYPPDSGPKIKTYNVLRYLAQQHELHLVSFVRSDEEASQAAHLGRYCAAVTTVRLRRSRVRDALYLAQSLLNGRSFLVQRDDSRSMRRAIQAALSQRRFDAIHVDQFSMAQFAIDQPVPLRVLDAHNAVWTIVRRAAAHERGVRRPLSALEWRKVRAYEGEVCRRFDRVTVVSAKDREDLEQAAGRRLPAHEIPIAVDTEALAFEPRTPEARHILSVATMFYPPNVEGIQWFAREVFPLVRQAMPDTQFIAAGSRPPEAITQLAHPDSGIVVPGYVPDLRDYLRRSALLVVPLHSGSGMRVKILEAFARGVPVVSTTIGVEGIDARAGEHLLVADEPGAFAQAVLHLLRSPEERTRLAVAGRRLVEAQYDWRTALAGLDEIYGTAGAPREQPKAAVAAAFR